MTEALLSLGTFVEGLPAAKRSGIYFLHLGQTVVYVGQAQDVRKRIGNHLAEGVKDFDRFSWISCPPKLLDQREREYIGRLVPRYNQCQFTNTIREMRLAGWDGAGLELGLPRRLPAEDAARYLGLSIDEFEALGGAGPAFQYQRYSRVRARRKVYTLPDLKAFAATIADQTRRSE